MVNIFDASNYSTNEPESITAGDFTAWSRADLTTTYDPTLYNLKYSLRPVAGGAEITFTADSSFAVEIPSATTATYTAGDYVWQSYIQRIADSERITLENGNLKVIANNQTTATDLRTHAQIVLDAIRAVIESRATTDQKSIQINGRSLERNSIEDLTRLEKEYSARVNKEARAKKGLGGKFIKVAFR